MSRINTLLENESVVSMLEENTDLLEEANASFDDWYGVMVDFVMENIEDFLDENLEETSKNVYTFATFATSQYLSEVSHVYGQQLEEVEAIKEAAEHEFV